MIGAFGGMFAGWLLRVEMPKETGDGYYYVPGQYPFYPKIVDETEGLPAYG